MGHSSIIALEGLPVVAAMLALAGVFRALSWNKAAVIFAALAVFSIWFFRNPERHTPPGVKLVIAPADGRIVFVGEVDEARYMNERTLKVSIFMNVFNVHVNRAPVAGKVSGIKYNPGKFISADRDKASMDNEQNALVMETADGKRVGFVQIAGLVARRIVCWVKPGEDLARGQRFGLIMFGSRVDVYMPAGSQPNVKLGDRTTAGETVIGTLP